MTWDCFADDGLVAPGVSKPVASKVYGARRGILSLCFLEMLDAV